MNLIVNGFALVLGLGYLAGDSHAQDRDSLPVDAQRVRADYLAQRKNGLTRLNQNYLDSLAALQTKYTEANDLDAALAIKKEMERVAAEIKALQASPVTAEGPETMRPSGTLAPSTPSGTPSVTATTGTLAGALKDTVIEPWKEDGVSLGKLKKGDKVILQYVSGKWKSHGELATEDPDAITIGHGDENRLGIFQKQREGSRPRLLILVPPGTKQKPFVYPIPDDYAEIVLRINEDPDGKWEQNPGSVVYKVGVEKGG
ncbi:MAG: hypothetical protein H7A53_12155 [Akkermansiaceae bacterium]|nr:hypothetical protein [Akkermansiaceae bacterium]MCP5551633.1 hypothetical protein [Akkermansiaceae bacterium]